jgi:hypothetical protein
MAVTALWVPRSPWELAWLLHSSTRASQTWLWPCTVRGMTAAAAAAAAVVVCASGLPRVSQSVLQRSECKGWDMGMLCC